MSSAHSPTFSSLHLRHNSFSNASVALPTSQLILQPVRCFTYVTAHSPTLLSFLLRHRLFTYATWRAAHGKNHYGGRAYLLVIGSLLFITQSYFIIVHRTISDKMHVKRVKCKLRKIQRV